MNQEAPSETDARFLATLAAQPRFQEMTSPEIAVQASWELLEVSRSLLSRKILENRQPKAVLEEFEAILKSTSPSWVKDLPPLKPGMTGCSFLEDAIQEAFRHDARGDWTKRKEAFLDWLAKEQHVGPRTHRTKTPMEENALEFLKSRDQRLNAIRAIPEQITIQSEWDDLVTLLALFKKASTSQKRSEAGGRGLSKRKGKKAQS